MAQRIDYYFAPHSPWTYLGHLRFWDIARKSGVPIRVLPVDLGQVFPVSGGLPLAKRAPQRQAYRLVELARFSAWLHAPLNLQPKYFPVNPDDAARLIIAVDRHDGCDAAMALADTLLRAVWVKDLNIADEAVLAAALAERELPAERLAASHTQAVQERYEADSQAAIDAGVFGAPSYVVIDEQRGDGGAAEIFWGQDRLDFLERRLRARAAPGPST
ncbi:MAG TPA: 2-hydroxychromene-2-carboxylate isomerase [Methylibium sp.]|uniref:2-hydroxychromene-2-carboxylate isomerase n=1 Tax=Methylibium sp. TaxID=2067992 RepID=UPI002DBBE52A|nr:2-hydroxychromene-2-carboxylate isomerase [Methylibium sp.]HEU4458890.1 2-hydroxychromene-2-carboxylate isomerase [Methylibium sp.]